MKKLKMILNKSAMTFATCLLMACGGNASSGGAMEKSEEGASTAFETETAEEEPVVVGTTGPCVAASQAFHVGVPMGWNVIGSDECSITVGVDDEHQIAIKWHDSGYEKAVAAKRAGNVVDLGEQAIGQRTFLVFEEGRGCHAFSKTDNGYVEVVGKNVGAHNEAMRKIVATLKMEKE